MAYTAADLDAVRQVKLQMLTEHGGAKTIQFSDRSVTFRSIDEIEQVETAIQRSLSTRHKQTIGVPVKGL